MTQASENTLKGNKAVASVMYRLTRANCLVRQVAADTDVGIDLYCETVAENKPFLHFWFQVKGGKQCHVDSSKESASHSFKLNHLQYWDRQPVPVFAALVPDPGAPGGGTVYVVDITTSLLYEKTPLSSGKTLSSAYTWPPDDQEGIHDFLAHVVPEVTARQMIKRGVVDNRPTLTEQYLKFSPYVPVETYEEEIQRQLRRTSALSIIHQLMGGPVIGRSSAFSKRLASILEQFDDDDHWETFAARALVHQANREPANARSMYDKSIELCNTDDEFRDNPRFESTLERLKTLRDSTSEPSRVVSDWPVNQDTGAIVSSSDPVRFTTHRGQYTSDSG
jgi:hypothetical protein